MKGSIILVENNSGGLLSKAIKFFTKRIAKKYDIPTYTHAMYEIGDLLEERMVLSTEPNGTIPLPLYKFRGEKTKFWIYRLKDEIEEKDIDKILRDCMRIDVDRHNRYLQLLWFIYRWFMELFNFDVRKQHNWFPNRDICSENTYDYLGMRVNNNKEKLADIGRYLKRWNQNTFHPVDLGVVIKVFSNRFDLVETHNVKS